MLPSPAAGRRLSKLKPERSYTQPMAEQRPHRSALSLFCLCCLFVHTLFIFSTGGNTLSFFICPFFEIVFLCSLIRNCFNRTNHHYVSSQKKNIYCSNLLPSWLLHWNEHIWQEKLASSAGAAKFKRCRHIFKNWHANTAQAHWITDVNISIFKDL